MKRLLLAIAFVSMVMASCKKEEEVKPSTPEKSSFVRKGDMGEWE